MGTIFNLRNLQTFFIRCLCKSLLKKLSMNDVAKDTDYIDVDHEKSRTPYSPHSRSMTVLKTILST